MIDPQDVRPLGHRILVRKYKKPEKIKSLWLNPVWRTDNSRALWEPIAYSEAAAEEIREMLDSTGHKDWDLTEVLLVTPPHAGVGVGNIETYDEDGESTLAYFIDQRRVIQIVPWEEE